MSEQVTKDDLKNLERSIDNKLNKAVDDLSDIIAGLAQNMHTELSEIKKEVVDIRNSLDRLTNTIDGFVKRLDDHETENTARDAQLARLERWIEQVAKKTGVKLEY